MKFLSFVRTGVAGYGAIIDDGIVDLTGRVQGALSLKEAIARNLLAEAAGMAADMGPGLASSDVTLLPVIPDPGKILCIGLNYEKHRAETKRPEASHPAVFVRFADSQVAHRQPIIKPKRSDRLDYEGELAVIIGRGGRNIPEANALDHVAGWSCYNDGSIRDYQRHTHQFTPGKTFPGTGAFGPYMMTPDEAGDHTSWPIETRLNGDVMQQATLSDLIFPIPRIIAYLSEFTPLSAGDVILTGTPGGVGDRREPPIFMKNGDVVEVEIGPLGTLINPICDEV
ncbi:FAA hydrolase family protein [Phyllobacterium salinisoli]|uniref:FAA hydrolase family protein n=1 Tax=Phyllobacterium salinisoli TaxID=1899321 RepID=A0A368JZ28_9HYPH|nr:fumarylacetoacetate hydrolase family protein [Phyllobacterium salinisoli]RCS21685.1 FAA hydrolase family protein [Phyllobacterium salinisoli]